MTKPVVAIVGRANVGKSTLLNRLAGERRAVIADLPGTTRDRVFASACWQGRELLLIDTGGWGEDDQSFLGKKVREQVEAAVAQADVVVFLVDAHQGLVATDEEMVSWLRVAGKPVVLVENKVDAAEEEKHATDFYRLGLDTPVSISAYHNRGIDALRKAVLERLPDLPVSSPRTKSMKLAIVGRPNVGKSTLLNVLLGEERAIVDNVPGTTRDSIDAVVSWDGKEISLVDTAGIRRRGRVKEKVEYYSLLRSLQAIDRCDIALLMIDATEPIALQDMHIAGYVMEACKGVLILVNKWDTILRENREEYRRGLKQGLHFMPYVPVVYISAMSGNSIGKILPAAWEVWQERCRRLPEGEVSLAVKKAVEECPPSPIGLRRLHILRAYQHRTKPVTFVLQVNDPKLVHFSYQRYLANKLRHYFGFRSSPVQLVFARTVTKPERATRR